MKQAQLQNEFEKTVQTVSSPYIRHPLAEQPCEQQPNEQFEQFL